MVHAVHLCAAGICAFVRSWHLCSCAQLAFVQLCICATVYLCICALCICAFVHQALNCKHKHVPFSRVSPGGPHWLNQLDLCRPFNCKDFSVSSVPSGTGIGIGIDFVIDFGFFLFFFPFCESKIAMHARTHLSKSFWSSSTACGRQILYLCNTFTASRIKTPTASACMHVENVVPPHIGKANINSLVNANASANASALQKTIRMQINTQTQMQTTASSANEKDKAANGTRYGFAFAWRGIPSE